MSARQILEFRKRGPNYTPEDKCLLADLVHSFKEVIEDRNTNNFFAAKKSDAWKAIASAYNKQCNSNTRTVEQLKALYDNLKQKARRMPAELQVKTEERSSTYERTETEALQTVLSIIKEKSQLAHSISNNLLDSTSNNSRPECFNSNDFNATYPHVTVKVEYEPQNESLEDELPDYDDNIDDEAAQKEDIPQTTTNRIKELKNQRPLTAPKKRVKKRIKTEVYKRLYFKKKYQNSGLERKKLLIEMCYMRQEHRLKMQLLKKQIDAVHHSPNGLS